MSDDEILNAETPLDERLPRVLVDVGIIGFDPYLDAVRQPLHDGVRIHYLRDDELRWVQRTRSYSDRWESPSTQSVDSLQSTLEAVDEFEIIDQRMFNLLTSGPLEDVHDGLVWGVVMIFGPQLKRGDIPVGSTLQSVPGVGEKRARQIRRGLASYPDEAYKIEEHEKNV